MFESIQYSYLLDCFEYKKKDFAFNSYGEVYELDNPWG